MAILPGDHRATCSGLMASHGIRDCPKGHELGRVSPNSGGGWRAGCASRCDSWRHRHIIPRSGAGIVHDVRHSERF